MMLVRYQNQVAGFVGATVYYLAPHLESLPPGDVDRRRVEAVCEWALVVLALTGAEPGRLPPT
jgi:hypothetical protein